jgi:hypothetical protein
MEALPQRKIEEEKRARRYEYTTLVKLQRSIFKAQPRFCLKPENSLKT